MDGCGTEVTTLMSLGLAGIRRPCAPLAGVCLTLRCAGAMPIKSQKLPCGVKSGSGGLFQALAGLDGFGVIVRGENYRYQFEQQPQEEGKRHPERASVSLRMDNTRTTTPAIAATAATNFASFIWASFGLGSPKRACDGARIHKEHIKMKHV